MEEDAYCIEVMKQLSALQSSLERSNRLVLLNHLETCFTGAVSDGRGIEALAELVDALSSTTASPGPAVAAALAVESAPLPDLGATRTGGD